MRSWLSAQCHEAMSFAQQSDVLSLAPIGDTSPHRYVARFGCNGLAMDGDRIVVADRHLVGIRFPDSYLRESCHPGEVLTWLEPKTEFHPNIRAPFCCPGAITPGMSLLNLLYQLYEMITWRRYTAREDDALNADACRWARANLHRLPVDPRRSMSGTRGESGATGRERAIADA